MADNSLSIKVSMPSKRTAVLLVFGKNFEDTLRVGKGKAVCGMTPGDAHTKAKEYSFFILYTIFTKKASLFLKFSFFWRFFRKKPYNSRLRDEFGKTAKPRDISHAGLS